MAKRLVGMLVFDAATCTVIVTMGGGAAFLSRTVAVVYLALWAIWWLVIAVGRRRGARSPYDRRQQAVSILGFIALCGFIVAVPWEYTHLSGPIPRDTLLAWLGLLLFAAGIILLATAMRALHGYYTSRLGVQPGQPLVTTGPYRFVRHPGYLGNLISLFGMSLALSSLVGLALAIVTVPLVLWRIGREEEMLLAEFGEAYQAYMQRTERLVPRF